MKIDFIKELQKLKPNVWECIESYLIDRDPKLHYKAVNEYPRRQGKYLRPGLVQLSAEMYGATKKEALLTSAALQLSEDWLLVHDDFLDHSLERRFTKDSYKPTLNQIYGDEIAVNAGDALHVLMWKILRDNVKFFDDKRGWEIYDKMNQILLITLEGQYLELAWDREINFDITEDDYFQMVAKKTCNYSIIGPITLGAIIAKQSFNELSKIREWGTYFGYAFQIQDDIMNLTVQTEIQGKEIAGDIWEGKRTLIFIHLLENCNRIEKDYLKVIYSKKRNEKIEQDVKYVLALMRKYSSINYAQKLANFCSKKALEIFNKNTTGNTHSRAIIQEGIKFVVNRIR